MRSSCSNADLNLLTAEALQWNFAFPAKDETELLRDDDGRLVGMIDRKQESIHGTVEITATREEDGSLFKLQVRVKNLTPLEGYVGETESRFGSDGLASLRPHAARG